jgi:hypothetical protein
MANPAQLLLNKLNSWRSTSAQQSAETTRGIRAGSNHKWLQHRIAVRHLDAIDELLNQMDAAGRNTTVFRRHFQSWGDMVFAYPNGWRGQGTASMDQTALEHLENLADRLDDFVPTLRPNGLGDIRAYAQGIKELLAEDPSIDHLLKLHVGQVIGSSGRLRPARSSRTARLSNHPRCSGEQLEGPLEGKKWIRGYGRLPSTSSRRYHLTPSLSWCSATER